MGDECFFSDNKRMQVFSEKLERFKYNLVNDERLWPLKKIFLYKENED